MKTYLVPVIFLSLLACASSKQVSQATDRLEKHEVVAERRRVELAGRLDDLASSLMILQDRLETLQLAMEKSAPTRKATRNKNFSKTSGRVSQEDVKPVEKPTGEPFLIRNDPKDSKLPAIRLDNQDLDRIDRQTAAPAPKMVSTEAENPGAVSLYNDAFQRFESRKYVEATKLLEGFVKKYPNHSYSDNAVFWIGESYYRQRDYARAARHFERVARDFPSGNKVPDALLRAGSSYLRMSKSAEARKAFTRLIDRYPNSVAAEKAETLIAELKGKSAPRRM